MFTHLLIMDQDHHYTNVDVDSKAKQFASAVIAHFSFLESQYAMKRIDVRVVDRGSAQDEGAVVRYLSDNVAVDICWGFAELVISIMIRYPSPTGRLSSNDPLKYLYFEPYVEFITQGELTPIVPQVPRTLSKSGFESVLEARESLLDGGIKGVLEKISSRLQNYGHVVLKGEVEDLREFHEWLGWDAWKLK